MSTTTTTQPLPLGRGSFQPLIPGRTLAFAGRLGGKWERECDRRTLVCPPGSGVELATWSSCSSTAAQVWVWPGWEGPGAGRAPGKAGPPRVEGSSLAPRERAWGAWAARLHTSS